MANINGITTGDILRRNAHNFPDKLALVDSGNGVRLTYIQWNNRVNQCIHMLEDIGIKKGDKVATWCFNQHEYLEVRFAVGKMGAVIIPVNFRLAAQEMQYIVDHSDAKVLIFNQGFAQKVDSVRNELTKVEHFIIAGENESNDWAAPYDKTISKYSDKEPIVDVSPDDTEAILYTSGTTGFPKGVVRPHYATVWTGLCHFFFVDEGVPRNNIWINAMPLFHLGAYECGFLPNVMVGATNITMRAFDPDKFLKIVENEKATGFFLVPAALSAAVSVQEKRQYDVSSLRYAYSAAAPLPMALKEKAEKVFNQLKLYEYYGSTELGMSNFRSPDADIDMPNVPCIGIESICNDVRVVKPDGSDVSPSVDIDGEVGEIAVKGPTILKEYYKNEEATKNSINKEGYLLTGDLARIDTKGNLYITGRSKEMIISGGENIYPAEIENVLFKIPNVIDATVIGVPDPKWGETPRALVVLKEGTQATEDEVIKYCKSKLAGYKCPTSVIFLESIPHSSSGKVQKYILKQAYGN